MSANNVSTGFDLRTGQWQIDWPQRVSRHDVVYLTPPEDPMQGMPAGNGDVGILLWTEVSKVVLAVNKSDLWDNDVAGSFHNWSRKEEERVTTLRHGFRLIVDFQLPVFDLFYLKDCRGRISLADAKIELAVDSAFGSVALDAFVAPSGVVCGLVKTCLEENLDARIVIERFGSRTFSHWYKLICRDATIGLSDADAFIADNTACVQQKLTSGTFVGGFRVISNNLAINYRRLHRRACSADIAAKSAEKQFDFIATVTAPAADATQASAALKRILDDAQTKGIAALYRDHAAAWQRFWLRSFMDCGDDYIDNLWHLAMYYANSSQRGAYPVRFINGLWGWNRDCQPWNFYFHWNQQQIYWPLNAAGHHDLCQSYLNYRFNALPHNKKDAAVLHRAAGAFVSDVSDRNGYNSYTEGHNYTPVAEIALDFWRQFQFTQDMDFLRQKALPYMLEAAEFMLSRFEFCPDGRYHAKAGTPYEGWLMLEDCLTVIAATKSLVKAVAEALEIVGDAAGAEKFKVFLSKIVDIPQMPLDKRYCRRQAEGGCLVFKDVFFDGYRSLSDKMLALGFLPADKRPQAACEAVDSRGAQFVDGVFPAAALSAVFPSGAVTLSDKGSDVFNAAANSALLQAPDCMGWDPLPIVLARLGLAEPFDAVLRHFTRWQIYPNGWGHYGPWEVASTDATLRFKKNKVQDTATSTIEGFDWCRYPTDTPEFLFPAWPFRHFGMEFFGVLACAVNESLLQSHEGIIRIGPAVHHRQNATFTLHARGGFQVSAQIQQGKPLWAHIKNLLPRKNLCKLANPWPMAALYAVESSGSVRLWRQSDESIVSIPLEENSAVLCLPAQMKLADWKVLPFCYQTNNSVKYSADGKTQLGLDRYF